MTSVGPESSTDQPPFSLLLQHAGDTVGLFYSQPTGSTMDHIHKINQIREKCRSYNLPLCLVFVDFEKAFDSVEISAILTSLKTLGVDHHYIHLLKDIYSNCSSAITLNNNKINFNINKGVRQGDTISSRTVYSLS